MIHAQETVLSHIDLDGVHAVRRKAGEQRWPILACCLHGGV
jgi:hypothetical protein